MKEPEFAEQLKVLGTDHVGSTRAELDRFRAGETKRIAELVNASGVNLQ